VQFLCDWDEGAGVSILRDLQSSTRQSPEKSGLTFEVGPAWSMGLDQQPLQVPPHLNESVIAGTVWGKTILSGPQGSISERRKSHLSNPALPSQPKKRRKSKIK